MKTIKRGVEFTGFVLLRHKACGYTVRIFVGTGFFHGYAPDGRSNRDQAEYDGCTWADSRFGKQLLHRCGCGKATFNIEVHGQLVYGRYVAEVICNAKCTGAVGPACDCSCGGKNHGGKWGAA